MNIINHQHRLYWLKYNINYLTRQMNFTGYYFLIPVPGGAVYAPCPNGSRQRARHLALRDGMGWRWLRDW